MAQDKQESAAQSESLAQLQNTAASINIVNWRLNNVGRVKLGPNDALAFLNILRTLNQIVPGQIETLEGNMTSADPEQQETNNVLVKAAEAFQDVDGYKAAA